VLVSIKVKALRAALVFFLASSLSVAAAALKEAPPPDIFLITIDTLRADHVHCYGYRGIQTPALDGLAHEGVRFAEAFTPSPITNTSHTSILTGLLPSSHGVTDFALPLAAAHPTLAELLRQNGYHTAAFIGAVILDSKTLAPGLDRGFDFYDNFPEHSQSKSRWGRVERRGMVVAQRAEAWLSAHPRGPHFVWVHLYDPHDPYEPPLPYSRIYKDRLYDGEIAYADLALANFIAYLKQRGWYRNSLIVVVGDHGEGLGEHREDTHGIFLYDSTTHVPLIVKTPGGAAADKAIVVDAQVRTTDILPTVLDLAGVPAPTKLDGESLTPYFAAAGTEMPERTVFGETDYPLRFGWSPLRSVRSQGNKFIAAPRPELYDLHADAGELENQYQPASAVVKKMRGMLEEVRADNPAGAASQTSLPDPKDKIEEQNLLHRAMMAGEDDRSADAQALLEEVLRLDPQSFTALRQLGELELRVGDYAHSAQHLQAAIRERPDDAAAAFDAGQALEKVHDLSGARDALEVSLKLAPDRFPARLLLGDVYLGLGNPRAADDQFEAALLTRPESAEAKLGVAKALMSEGNLDDAVRQLDSLSKSQPEKPEVFELLAEAYGKLGKKAQAENAAAKARRVRKKR
jgi:arylsulfatase A-like enzyme/Tfp pilus assembly protein PilF